MARPLRIEYPGAVYHVTSRGNAGQKIFRSDKDKEYILEFLAHLVERFRWFCHAYCLMDNHYHLVIETSEANLSRGMRQVPEGWFNVIAFKDSIYYVPFHQLTRVLDRYRGYLSDTGVLIVRIADGNRYENIVKLIEKSYRVLENLRHPGTDIVFLVFN